ncbi:phage repressor protein C with HTH and peptisase S24 domain [Herbaspirillum seropedicae]|nr:S24 family peptidase [Herbaspirillum seropedicae]MDR6394655.1 phage repressor protein C with HTH and peptisase S24 domain [Herbaspirillum seropedicae]
MSLEGMMAAEEAIGCRSAWLRTGEGDMLTSKERRNQGRPPIKLVTPDSPKIVHVRSVVLTLRAGFTGVSSDAFEEDGDPFPVSQSWLQSNGFHLQDLVAARIRGQSMAPNLNEDDIAVIHLKSKRPIDGKVFAVNFDGEGVIKRLVYDYKRWFLYSDNPDQNRYRPQEASMAPNFIIGQVVAAQKFNL